MRLGARPAALGFALAAVYLLASLVSAGLGLLPARPVFDGLSPPPPYRWLKPPKDLARDNEQPLPGLSDIELTEQGSQGRSVATDDGQAVATFPDGTFAPAHDQTAVTVSITAVLTSAATMPNDLEPDGNAYRFAAAYKESKAAAAPAKPMTIILRYPTYATALLRLDRRRWRILETSPSPQSLQLFADTTALGTFVAAGPPISKPGGFPAWGYIAGGSGLLAAAAGLVVSRRRSSVPTNRAARRRRQRGRRNP